MRYSYVDEATVSVRAPPSRVFDYLDDQVRLAAHMEKPSTMMMGGKMSYDFDDAKGRAVGSVIKMSGGILGVKLFVEEIITDRDPPRRKVWETRGRPRILIIDAYRMGFDIESVGDSSSLRVFIEYNHPPALTWRILGTLFAPIYARWCVRRMAKDAQRHFSGERERPSARRRGSSPTGSMRGQFAQHDRRVQCNMEIYEYIACANQVQCRLMEAPKRQTRISGARRRWSPVFEQQHQCGIYHFLQAKRKRHR